jgi:hypothetical protein
MRTANSSTAKAPHRTVTAAVLLGFAFTVSFGIAPALAQGWWPWSNSEPERPPVPDEPVYRGSTPGDPNAPYPQPGYPQPGSPPQQGPAGQAGPPTSWSTKNPICLQLEQRLVQDSQRTSQSRNDIPRIEAEIRQAEQASDQADQDLQRRQCYEYFLFAKSLRRTRTCVDLARQKDIAQRQISDLEAQRQQILGSSERSYRADIVRELARNNCGANYTQEARRQDRGPFSSIWQDEEGGGGSNNGWAPYSGPSAGSTYRTVCVRLCDGYYFPVSFSTLPSHFQQDAAVCQSKCAAPVELYYYQNPGATVDQSIALRTNEPYTSLKTAFRYRKELVKGCSCKEAEFVPDDAAKSNGKRAEGGENGWEARSEWEGTTAGKARPR